MRRKTKIAFYLILIGIIMFFGGILYSSFILDNPFSETGLVILFIIVVPGGVIGGIGFSMLRFRLNRWMEED